MNTENTKTVYQVAWHEESDDIPAYYTATDRDDAWQQFEDDPGADKTPRGDGGDTLAPRSDFTIEIATSRWWSISDGFDTWGEEMSPDPAKALEQAEENVREKLEKPHHTEGGTTWVQLSIESTDDKLQKTLDIDPEPPHCEEGKTHDWEQDDNGVTGHGGGVIVTSTCKHCALKRTIDTWAQDASTGEQGLHSVQYDDSVQEAAWDGGPEASGSEWLPNDDDDDDGDDEDDDDDEVAS